MIKNVNSKFVKDISFMFERNKNIPKDNIIKALSKEATTSVKSK